MPRPNFLIIGERRSGTTTLGKWIECHPEIFLHPRMDMGYFIDKELVGSKTWTKGNADYAKWNKEHSIDEYVALFNDASKEKAIGEKSADYLFWHHSHERIKSYFPDIKLIVTLRNPIHRAWSMYWNEIGKGRESLSFEDAIKEEDERIKNSDFARNHLSYKTRGFYDESLTKLFEVFNRENIYVLILDKAKDNPRKYLKEIYNFLKIDVNKGFENADKTFNKNWTLVVKPYVKKYALIASLEKIYFKIISTIAKVLFPRKLYLRRDLIMFLAMPFRKTKSDHKLKDETYEKLLNLYKPHINNLEKILNEDLSLWLKK